MDMETVEQARRQAKHCGVFANYRRVMILWMLVEKERSVSAIATAVDISLQSASQHLRLMKERGVLQSRREGQTVFYSTTPDTTPSKCRFLTEARQKHLSELDRIGLYYDWRITMSTEAVDLTAIQATKVIDARASACPGPLLEAKKGIGTVNVGEVLEVWSGGAQTRDNIPKWCKKIGHEYMGHLVAEGGYDKLFIKRGR